MVCLGRGVCLREWQTRGGLTRQAARVVIGSREMSGLDRKNSAAPTVLDIGPRDAIWFESADAYNVHHGFEQANRKFLPYQTHG